MSKNNLRATIEEIDVGRKISVTYPRVRVALPDAVNELPSILKRRLDPSSIVY